MTNYLFVIPARGGSKGLPGKNIKKLNNIPLISYSLGYARLFTDDENICITTDDPGIAWVAEMENYKVPFFRPPKLSGDNAGMRDVLLHALHWYETSGRKYDAIVLLQPTSPFRKKFFFEEAVQLFSLETDMVVTVNESKANPYFNLFEETENGFLELSKKSLVVSRQTARVVYQYNGNMYIINTNSLQEYQSLSSFQRIVKYLLPDGYSIDIDTPIDWNIAEYLLNNHIVEADGKL